MLSVCVPVEVQNISGHCMKLATYPWGNRKAGLVGGGGEQRLGQVLLFRDVCGPPPLGEELPLLIA